LLGDVEAVLGKAVGKVVSFMLLVGNSEHEEKAGLV
jgi:hypothetical protein